MCHGQIEVIIYINLVQLEYILPHVKLNDHTTFSVGKEKIFDGFNHIWTWWPYLSCEQDHLYKLSFLLPKKTAH